MKDQNQHNFHIPVMGLGFTIDTPIKVAQFGISSVASIMEDHLVEQMRSAICKQYQFAYVPIAEFDEDYRARRITKYLNLLHKIVQQQITELRAMEFYGGNKLDQYYQLLPTESELKRLYQMLPTLAMKERKEVEARLRENVRAGSIDVNIMTKLDKTNYDKNGVELATKFSDALSAFRGFANSDLEASVIFSAGLNPRLYGYCEEFSDFIPDASGFIKKKIVLKVSDFRSALIQGKFLAKKGLWVSEYRIESGINCGGHAFVSSGLLMGPILEEFKNRKDELAAEIFSECQKGLLAANKTPFTEQPSLKITAQGGIGTALENELLLDYYSVDGTGWGSPFLLVPEVTNVEPETLEKLSKAKQSDYFLSHASPLGVPFHNFKLSSSEEQRKQRITKNRPGSPCYKKFLSSNTEFTEMPICTASRQYQNLKIKELNNNIEDKEQLNDAIEKVLAKDCLCEGLGASALLKNEVKIPHKMTAVAVCPGPNLAFFSGVFSFKQMVDHIYGRTNLLNTLLRPNLFLNELKLYFDYLQNDIRSSLFDLTPKKKKSLENFKDNLLEGINYYNDVIQRGTAISKLFDVNNRSILNDFKEQISRLFVTTEDAVVAH